MTLDLMGWREQMFQSTWLSVLIFLAAASCVLYYVSHVRRGSATAKSTLMGQPLTLLVILGALIVIIAVVTQVWDIQLA